jgi:hypothetical protein
VTVVQPIAINHPTVATPSSISHAQGHITRRFPIALAGLSVGFGLMFIEPTAVLDMVFVPDLFYELLLVRLPSGPLFITVLGVGSMKAGN